MLQTSPTILPVLIDRHEGRMKSLTRMRMNCVLFLVSAGIQKDRALSFTGNSTKTGRTLIELISNYRATTAGSAFPQL